MTLKNHPLFNSLLAIDTGRSARELLNEIKAAASRAIPNDELPIHVRQFAQWLSIMAETVDQKLFCSKVDPMEIARLSLVVGMIYQRFKLAENERPAMAGKKIRAAAQREGRSAPEGSLRDKFEQQVKNWHSISTPRLLMIAKKMFPHRTQENLCRQIRKMKKGGL